MSPLHHQSHSNVPLDEIQDTEFKRTIANVFNEFKAFRQDTTKYLNEPKKNRDKVIEIQEKTNR